MKTLSQQNALFGDYYYNSSRKELVEMAAFFKKYSLSEISDYFKVVMQDILAHIIGSTSFLDACMVRDKLNYEAIINTRIGKKKLVEFLSLLEELDKLGIHIDEVEFNSNENDEFLNRAKDNIATCKGINLSYLSFNNLDEFLEMIIMAITVRPMARNKEDFNVFIPDPSNFDFKNNYYETIDYLMYRQDKERHNAMMAKHENIGREINLIEWIKKYRERYDLREIITNNLDVIATNQVENSKQTISPAEFINFASSNDYDFTNDELNELSILVNNKYREIANLYHQVRLMRGNVLTIMHNQDLSLSESEIKKEEQEYVMETVISKMTGKKRNKKSIVSTIYAVIIATLVLIPTLNKNEKTLEDGNANFIEVSDEKLEEESPISIEITKEEPLPLESPEENIDETETPIEEDEYLDQDDEEEEIKDAYVTDFKIGDEFYANIPYYISASSTEILGFLDDDVVVIGYFGVLEGDKGPVLFKSIRTQEEMDKFLRLYHGDHHDIHWRAAVASASNQKVKDLLERGEEIPSSETICYVDCVPVKQRRLIKGK